MVTFMTDPLMHRNHGSYPGDKAVSPEKSFMRYMHILMTEAAVLQSMLHELGPGFVVCHRYDMMLDKEQAARVAEFAAPTLETAELLAASMLRVARPTLTSGRVGGSNPRYPGETVIIERLQRKLDALEAAHCG